MTTADTVRELAPAKINLCLHVTGRRVDGYHLLDSLVMFAGPEAADRVHLTPGALSLRVTGPMAEGVPTGPDNLALRAAALVGGGAIHIDKHLPSAAGIGGGTADGAAVIRAGGGRTLTPARLLVLGSDMPVCVFGRAARMRGIGEEVTALDAWPSLPAVLVNPGISVATPAVFRALARPDNAPLPGPLPHPASIGAAVDWLAMQRNDLEPPALALAPKIGTVLAALRSSGAALARMSGSGATCFGLYDSRAAADRAAATLARPGWWVRATDLR